MVKLFDGSHCIPRSHYENYENSVLIIRAELLKESHRTAENQLFFARGGFGCSPTARGRAVMGQFLIDGEEAWFAREDFVGIMDENHLPEWAHEKLQEQDCGMKMSG